MVGPYSLNLSSAWGGTVAPPERTAVVAPISYSKLPLSFEVNQGQADPQVKYLARESGYTLMLTPDATILRLRGNDKGQPARSFLRLKLRGADSWSVIRGEHELPGRSNYFMGNDPGAWHTNIPTFQQVRYQQIYPGVDLVYYGRQGQLENDFVLRSRRQPPGDCMAGGGSADGIR